jgi:hypothetical protein
MDRPKVGTIIQCGGFDYHYLGSYHDMSDEISKYLAYDQLAPNYFVVKAVYLHNGEYYYIPSIFSNMGTLNPPYVWELKKTNPGDIKTLDMETCKKVCPGYLDIFSYIPVEN